MKPSGHVELGHGVPYNCHLQGPDGMPFLGVKLKTNKGTVLSSEENVITPSTTVACPCGYNRITDLSASKTGWSKESEMESSRRLS